MKGIHRQRADVADDQGIAVGIGARHFLHREVAAAASLVLHDDRLAQAFFHLDGEGAGDDGGAAAGREGHDEAEWV
jgi:hypothetical protein